MEDTSIYVTGAVELHVEVDLAVHPGSMMQHESTGDDMSMSKHTMLSDSSQRNAEICSHFQMDIVDCREDTHLGEYADVDVTPFQQLIVMISHLNRFNSCIGDERGRLVYQQLEELLLVVPDD
jgi:hypothetical protein